MKDADLIQEGVREAISGKPVYVHDGHVGDLTTLEPYQRDPAYHRTRSGGCETGRRRSSSSAAQAPPPASSRRR